MNLWWLYEILYCVGIVLYLPSALWRRRIPHAEWSMRIGHFSALFLKSIKGKRPIWLHAVSVGEVLAAAPLVDALLERYPDRGLVISTITPTGHKIARKRFGDRVPVVYFPLDLSMCIKRAFDVINPSALLLMESELWPNTIRLAKKREIPVAVINGRISPTTFSRYSRFRKLIKPFLNSVDIYLMQTDEDAKRALQSGIDAGKVHVCGNLKWESSLSVRYTAKEIQDKASQLGLTGSETVLVAGSTHKGEEEILVQAVKTLRENKKDIRLLIAPRHLERLDEIEALIKRQGMIPIRCSKISSKSNWDVGLIDEMGSLMLYYSLSTITFVGGSLIPHGGQNPLEPASVGKPILFGPSMYNFAQITQELIDHQGACQVTDGSRFLPALQELLHRKETTKQMGELAWQLVQRSKGAAERTLKTLQPCLNGLNSKPISTL